jgi:hypothetical protein
MTTKSTSIFTFRTLLKYGCASFGGIAAASEPSGEDAPLSAGRTLHQQRYFTKSQSRINTADTFGKVSNTMTSK